MNTFIDIDSLNSVQEVIASIKMYHLLAKNGAMFSNTLFSADENDHLYCILEDYAVETFPEHNGYVINDPESGFPSTDLFQDILDYFNIEEVSVVGLMFLDYLSEFYEKCKEAKMDISDTFLPVYVDDFNRGIMQCGDGISYMELFIPLDPIIEETHSPLMLFYTDPTLMSYESLCALYDAFNYCRDVVDGKIELRGGSK